MISILLIMIFCLFIILVLCPKEHQTYLYYYTYFISFLLTVYTLIFLREFDFNSQEYQLFEEIRFFVGLSGITVLAMVLTSFIFLVGLVLSWREIQNKAFLLCFFAGEFVILFVLACWYNQFDLVNGYILNINRRKVKKKSFFITQKHLRLD